MASHDMHFWLDPENARAMVGEIATALSEADPGNARDLCGQCRAATGEKLDALIAETQAPLDAPRGPRLHRLPRRLPVFREALRHRGGGVDHRQPGRHARRAAPVARSRRACSELGAACVFAEPQFEPRLVDGRHRGHGRARPACSIRSAPTLEDGPELYFELIRNLTHFAYDLLVRRLGKRSHKGAEPGAAPLFAHPM